MESIDELTEILGPIAKTHETLNIMHWVTQSTIGESLSPENMSEHGSLEEYCDQCIDQAVLMKHSEWSDERNILMGQIYEAKSKGYYTMHGYGNDGKFRFRKVKACDQRIKKTERDLKKKYRIGTIFSYESLQLSGYETNGFRYCEQCNKMFHTSLLLDDQELEHWEDLTDEDYRNLSPREAFQLIDIFYEGNSGNHELQARCENLANRVLNIIT